MQVLTASGPCTVWQPILKRAQSIHLSATPRGTGTAPSLQMALWLEAEATPALGILQKDPSQQSLLPPSLASLALDANTSHYKGSQMKSIDRDSGRKNRAQISIHGPFLSPCLSHQSHSPAEQSEQTKSSHCISGTEALIYQMSDPDKSSSNGSARWRL